MLEKTITSNNKVRLNPQYPLVAGVDDNSVPQIIKVKSDGALDLGGVTIPEFDTFNATYFGDPSAHTNNLKTVTYLKAGNVVGRWDFTYINSAVSDNDDIATAVFTPA